MDNEISPNPSASEAVPLPNEQSGTPVSVPQAESTPAKQDHTSRQASAQHMALRSHFENLSRQARALKEIFPEFDLREEIKNPAFLRMTAPGSPITPEDAYYALHRKEIQARAMKIAAEKTAEKLANAIRSGSMRPRENGASHSTGGVLFDYRSATKSQREDLKRRIRLAAARGEKIFPK